MSEVFDHADTALTTSVEGPAKARLQAMAEFMRCIEQLARDLSTNTADWQLARLWAARNANRLRTARETLSDWDLETGRVFYGGGEEAVERALQRRSQFALARELFRDTAAEEMLFGYDAQDVDQEFREQAERLGLEPPEWLPPSHTWWSWPK